MSILSVNLDNINHDDMNYEELNLENAKHQKKISEDLIPIAWHPKRW